MITSIRRVLGKKKEALSSTPLPQRRVLGKPKQEPTITPATEAFEYIKAYYKEKNQPIPIDDIKWYQEELVREKKELDEFWERCAVTKARMDGTLRGDDEWTIQLAENVARQKVKLLPIQESDIGPMPEYGTKEFWVWCSKRKKLKEQKATKVNEKK